MTIKINGTNTAANPSITGSDTDTGIVYGSDQIDFSTGGTSKVTLNGSNFGIGTQTPDVDFHISGGSSVSKIESTASAASARLIIKSANNTYTGVHFGDDADDDVGRIRYYHNTDHMQFSVGASERMRINSTGHALFGTTTDTVYDDNSGNGVVIRGANGAVDIKRSNDLLLNLNRVVGDGGFIRMSRDGATKADIGIESNDLTFDVNSSERMRIQSDGDVSFSNSATGSAQIKNVNGNQNSVNGGGFPQYGFAGNEGTGMRRPSSNNLAFDTSGDERMRLDDAGNLNLGTTSNPLPNNSAAMMHVLVPQGKDGFNIKQDSTHHCFNIWRSASDGNVMNFYRGSSQGGSVGLISITGSSTTYSTSSDYRLKENVTAISDGITRLKTLKPYRFNFKVEPSKTVDGFFAHEVTAVPEAITGTKDEVYTEAQPDLNIKAGDPKYQAIDQSKLVPLLTAALQEAVAKIEVLETKVAALEAA